MTQISIACNLLRLKYIETYQGHMSLFCYQTGDSNNRSVRHFSLAPHEPSCCARIESAQTDAPFCPSELTCGDC